MAELTHSLKRFRSDGTRKVSGAVSDAASKARRRHLHLLWNIVWFGGFALGGFLAVAIIWYVVTSVRED